MDFYDMDTVTLAMIIRRLAPVMIGVALFAYFGRSRIVLVLGMAGLLLGIMVPERVVYEEGGFGAESSLRWMYERAEHVVEWSTTGAVIGTLVGYVYLLWKLYCARDSGVGAANNAQGAESGVHGGSPRTVNDV